MLTERKGESSKFWRETLALYKASSTTEKSYYPAIKELWTRLLEGRGLPFEVRVETSEGDRATGIQLPDLALYDRGEFVSVLVEVKTPDVEIGEMVVSTEQKNQVGRYLARTGVILVSNIRAVGLVSCKAGYVRQRNMPGRSPKLAG